MGKNFVPDPSGKIHLALQYEWDVVPVTQEYHLMDGAALLSALGGSLGLFLGLSLYHIADSLLNAFCSMAVKITSLSKNRRGEIN